MSDQKPCLTTIDLLRHGEPVGGKKYRGKIDDPLSDTGWAQMRAAVAEHCPWDTIVCSPLKRCSEFADEVAQRHDVPVHQDERLMEISFGEWEGRSATELMQDDPQRLHRFWSDPLNNTPPGAETLHEFEARILAAWNELLDTHKSKHILLISHAGTMRMIMGHVLGTPLERMFRIRVALAGLTRIEVEHATEFTLPRLLFHGGNLD